MSGRKRKGEQGHPARLTRRARRAKDRHQTPRDHAINDLVGLVRREANVIAGEGLIVGALGAAARLAARELVNAHDLRDEWDEPAIASYLTERLGGVIDTFDPVSYATWLQGRSEDRRRAAT